MKQFAFGFLILLLNALPPVANLLESIMIVHMHMQMPLLVFAGFLMARLFQMKYPHFFEKWNHNGVPGILLFIIVVIFWTIPRTMDETLSNPGMEVWKFMSLSLFAGISLRDSWRKLSRRGKNLVFVFFTVKYLGMGLLYIQVPFQLCNNYLVVDQITLGWGFLTTAICIATYLIYKSFINDQVEDT